MESEANNEINLFELANLLTNDIEDNNPINLLEGYNLSSMNSNDLLHLLESHDMLVNIFQRLSIRDLKNLRKSSFEHKRIVNIFILSKVKQKYYYDLQGINESRLMEIDFISLLRHMEKNFDISLIEWLASRGHLKLLRFLIEVKNVVPFRRVASVAATFGHIKILAYLSSLTPPIFPGTAGINFAARNGHSKTIDWLAGNRSSIKKLALKYNHIDTLEWLPFNMPVPEVDFHYLRNREDSEIKENHHIETNRGKIYPITAFYYNKDENVDQMVLANNNENEINVNNNIEDRMVLDDEVNVENIQNNTEDEADLEIRQILEGESSIKDEMEEVIIQVSLGRISDLEMIPNTKFKTYYVNEEGDVIGPRLLPSRKGVDLALGNNREEIVKKLLSLNIYPKSRKSIYIALSKGYTDIVDILFNFPDKYDFDLTLAIKESVRHNCIKSLNFLYESFKDDEHQPFVLHSTIMLQATQLSNIETVEWLINKGVNIRSINLDCALKCGKFDMLEWLIKKKTELNSNSTDQRINEQKKEFELNSDLANRLIRERTLKVIDILNYLEKKNILPSSEGANHAYVSKNYNDIKQTSLTYKQINKLGKQNNDVVSWLNQRNIFPDENVPYIVISMKSNSLDNAEIVEQIKLILLQKIERENNLLPTSKGADLSIVKKYYNILDWLIQKEIYPTSEGADYACIYGDYQLLERLESINIHATGKAYDYAIMHSRDDMKNWLGQRGILPTSESADYAFKNNDEPLLWWLKERDIFPSSANLYPAVVSQNHGKISRLLNIGIVPTEKEIEYAYRNRYFVILNMFAQKGYFPSEECVNNSDPENMRLLMLWLKDNNLLSEQLE